MTVPDKPNRSGFKWTYSICKGKEMMNARLVLTSEHDWTVYKEKLDFVQGFKIPHVGKPEKYPCLAITEFSDDGLATPQWEHLYVYSAHPDDLRAIFDRLDADGVKQIARAQRIADGSRASWTSSLRDAQPLKEIGPKDEEWDKFWDGVGDTQKDPNVSGDMNRRQSEWNEYESTRLAIMDISTNDFSGAVKLGKAFCDRWPQSTYKELIVLLLKDIQKRGVAPTPPPASEDGIHDYYPAVHWSNVPKSTEAAEPKSRISRRATKEVNFVNED